MVEEKKIKRKSIITCLIVDLLIIISYLVNFRTNDSSFNSVSTEILVVFYVFMIVDTIIFWVYGLCNNNRN